MISIFESTDIDTLKSLVRESPNAIELFKKLKMSQSTKQYKRMKKTLAERGIDISHWPKRRDDRVGQGVLDEDMFRCGSHQLSDTLKRRILKRGLKPYRCVKCDNAGEWEGEPLALQLDHINGDTYDNRLENLRFLCPNCHAQTPTFAGRKRNLVFNPLSLLSKERLTELVWSKPITHLAKDLDRSRWTITKYCRQSGIEMPPFAYWERPENRPKVAVQNYTPTTTLLKEVASLGEPKVVVL